ncbi:MAG: metallophosphoesterase [Clostridia bacterium]|jgi:putative phosphoesterase|nr:metallophosphoesterase [Clostridia bacterium]
MSSIAVISDSHGSLRNLSLFRSRIGQPDALWHLGDCAEDAPLLAQRMNCGYVSVRGNCDPFSDAPLKQIIDWHHRRFLLLHGHTVSGRLNLLYLAKEQRCDAVLFGHSHVPSAECVDGIWMINPGSLSRPRSSEGPSMALLTLDDAVFDVQLLFAK